MQSEKANGDILELGTEIYGYKEPVDRTVYRFHRLVQRERCASMIQTTRRVHHILIESRRDLVRLTIVHRPHRPDHRTETSELHRRRENPDSSHLRQSYDTQRDTQIRGS